MLGHNVDASQSCFASPQRKVFVCVMKGATSHADRGDRPRASVRSECVQTNTESSTLAPAVSIRAERGTIPNALPAETHSSTAAVSLEASVEENIEPLLCQDVSEDYDEYVRTRLLEASPQVLATFNPNRPVRGQDTVRLPPQPKAPPPIDPQPKRVQREDFLAGRRLHEQATEKEKRLNQLRMAELEKEEVILRSSFKPTITPHKVQRLRGEIVHRLADEDVAVRRDYRNEVASKEAVKASSNSFSPTLTRHPALVRRTKSVVEQQQEWEENRRRHLEEMRSQAEANHNFTPQLNHLSKTLAVALRAEEGNSGPVHERLFRVGEEHRRKLERERITEVEVATRPPSQGAASFLNRVKTLCGESVSKYDRLHAEAAERARDLEEMRRERDMLAMAECTSASLPFTPRINDKSSHICASRRKSAVDNRHDDCVHEYQLESATNEVVNEVTNTAAPHISSYSESLALERLEREGIAHIPVHERLVSSGRTATSPHPSRRRPLAEVHSFSPSVNKHSALIDKQVVRPDQRGSGINRVAHLYEKQKERDCRLEALRQEQCAYERSLSSKVTLIRRGSGACDTGRPVNAVPISERTAMWSQRREAKLDFQRRVQAQESLADCTFNPIVGR